MDIRMYLKNLPAGTTLYSVVSGEVTFKEIRDRIIVVLNHNHCEQLYHYTGRLWNSGLDGECLLFPSKEIRDWKSFSQFKRGDIIVDNTGIIAIFDSITKGSGPDVVVYKAIRKTNGKIIVKTDVGIGYASNCRLATKEEKDLFFDSLSKAGYTWNGEEVITVFKKGDIVISRGGGSIAIVDHVGEFGGFKDVIYYQCCIDYQGDLTVKVNVGVGHVNDCIYASTYDQERILKKLHEHGYVLKGDTVIKKRFDPKSFEPFQKVLTRPSRASNWRCTFFSHIADNTAICSDSTWIYCIPYENNEHLRGTTNDCDKFYQWWKNN